MSSLVPFPVGSLLRLRPWEALQSYHLYSSNGWCVYKNDTKSFDYLKDNHLVVVLGWSSLGSNPDVPPYEAHLLVNDCHCTSTAESSMWTICWERVD